jgi:hypothetical protein
VENRSLFKEGTDVSQVRFHCFGRVLVFRYFGIFEVMYYDIVCDGE